LLLEQMDSHGVKMPAERLHRVVAEILALPGRGYLLLARQGGLAVGVAYVAIILSVEHCGPVAWLEELYVSSDCRRQGIGTALLKAALQHARMSGIVAIDLEVDSAHRRAESLYQRFGFRPLDRSRWVKTLFDD
jgi:GNAT superfamily N-acetyltransferase